MRGCDRPQATMRTLASRGLAGIWLPLFFADPTEGQRHMSNQTPTGRPDKAGVTIAVVYRPIVGLKLDPNNPRLHKLIDRRTSAQVLH